MIARAEKNADLKIIFTFSLFFMLSPRNECVKNMEKYTRRLVMTFKSLYGEGLKISLYPSEAEKLFGIKGMPDINDLKVRIVLKSLFKKAVSKGIPVKEGATIEVELICLPTGSVEIYYLSAERLLSSARQCLFRFRDLESVIFAIQTRRPVSDGGVFKYEGKYHLIVKECAEEDRLSLLEFCDESTRSEHIIALTEEYGNVVVPYGSLEKLYCL